MKKLLLLTLFNAFFVLNPSWFFAQCMDPVVFYDQTSLDSFFANNPSCTSMGTVMIDNTGEFDPISNLNAMSNVTSIDSLIIFDYMNNMDLGGLNNLTTLANLTTFMVHDFSFCSNITNIIHLHIEYHEDVNSSNQDVDFSGFDNLQSAHSINLGFYMPSSNYINIFPSLTTLDLLNFEPFIYNQYYTTAFGTLDGFHALTTIESVLIGTINIFLCAELSIGNSLISVGQLHYLGASFVFNSFQNTQTIYEIYILSESQQTISLPLLHNTSMATFYLLGNDQFYFPELHTAGDLSILYGGQTSLPEIPCIIETPTLTSCNHFTLTGYTNFADNALSPLVANFNQLDSIHNSITLSTTNLTDLTLFPGLSYIGGTINIEGNPELSACSIEAICNRLNIAPNDATITGNLGDCAELADVAAGCVIPTITGQVYYDLNCNAFFDTEDIAVSHPLIMDSDMNATGSSNSNGQYTIVAIPNGVLTYQPSAPAGTITPSTITIDTDTLSGNTVVDFALCPDGTFHDVAVDAALSTWIRNGFLTQYAVVLTNHSFHSETAQLDVDFNLFAQFSDWDITMPYSIVGQTIVFDPIVLGPFEQKLIYIRGVLSTWTPLGTPAQLTADVSIMNTDLDNSNNTSQVNAVVAGSYDPNDIMVNQPLIDVEQAGANGDWLTYRIRFQNTGTFPADFVNVVSEQDELVDMSTIQMIASSHSNVWSFDGREVTWYFENIQLPDSLSDPEGSQGYVIYKVRTLAGLGVGDLLEVNAAIYFDYNEPVITNTATTEYYICPTELSVAQPTSPICQYDIIEINASAGYESYVWTWNNQTLSTAQSLTFAPVDDGPYTLTCMAVGTPAVCQSTASIELQVAATPSIPTITADNNTLTASGSGPFVWALNGNVLNTTSNTLEITQSGEYSVYIDGPCPSGVASGDFTYLSDEKLTQDEWMVYPNPAHNMVYVQNAPLQSIIEIIDITGRICFTSIATNGLIEISIVPLASGPYTIRVMGEDGQKHARFIKE